MSDNFNNVQDQAIEAGQKAYSKWQQAKDYARANPGTVLGIAAALVFVGWFIV